MKQYVKKICAVTMALIFICMNQISAGAANNSDTVDNTAPSVQNVQSEAQSTAAYLLTKTDFTDLSDTSKLYNASKTLILSIRSGYDCSKEAAVYLESAKSLVKEGALNVTVAQYGYPNDIYIGYACLITVLTLLHQDVTHFENVNLIASFDTLLAESTAADFTYGSDPVTYENSGMNPYYLGIIYSTVTAYKDSFTNYDRISANIMTALQTLCKNGQGIDYYGTSADNNGNVLPMFADACEGNADLKTLVDTSIHYVEETFFDEANGSSHSIYTDYETGQTIDTANPDATALALALYAQYNHPNAAASYNALQTLFKSTTTSGAYTYGGADNLFATQDALTGLVTYLRVLEGKTNPFDISDVIADQNSENIQPTQPESTMDNTDNASQGSSQNESQDNSQDGSRNDSQDVSQDGSQNDNASPKTGDSADTCFYIVLTMLAALLFAAARRTRFTAL